MIRRQINKRNLLLPLWFSLSIGVIILFSTVAAVAKSKTTIVVESTELGDGIGTSATTAAGTSASASNEISESEISTVFGSQAMSGLAGCKTEELSRPVLKGLRSDCQAWIKDQRSELGKRFLTSVCEDACSDCGVSLQRCTVTGVVRYNKAALP